MSAPDEPAAPLGYRRFERRAGEVAQDRAGLRSLGQQALDRIEARGGRLGAAVDDLGTMLRLMNAWVRAEYRQVPRETFVIVVAAILYFVAPMDTIPDFLPGLGFVDDAAVVAWVARRLRRDLSDFRDWEQRQDSMATFIGRSPLREDPE